MNRKLKYLALCFLIFSPFHFMTSYGQSNDEIWPEVDILYRVNDKFRLMTMLSGTKRESQYADGSFAAYLDYFTFPFVRKPHSSKDSSRGYYQWVRLGYTYGQSTGSLEDDDAFKEHTINMESNTRFHLPYQFLATTKNRMDFRVLNGTLKARYRPRVTLERDCKTEYLTFTMYGYGEYFFDFNSSTQNKYRICLGAEVWVSKIISFETYYLMQFATGGGTDDVNAVGLALKFNFVKKHKINNAEKEPKERIRSK